MPASLIAIAQLGAGCAGEDLALSACCVVAVALRGCAAQIFQNLSMNMLLEHVCMLALATGNACE